VLTTPPAADTPFILLAKALRKLPRDADPLLPPSAPTSVLKLVCSAASAELAVLLLVDAVPEVLDKDVIRLCKSLPSEWPLPLQPLTCVLEVEPALCELDPSDCAWSAARRLLRNCWNAWTVVASSEPVAEDALDVDALDADALDALGALVVDPLDAAVLLVSEAAPVAVVAVPTPIDCSACRIAAISPPPSGGWPVSRVALVLDVVPWFCLRNREGSHVETDTPALAIELTLMIDS
jgi:hypothetical protein